MLISYGDLTFEFLKIPWKLAECQPFQIVHLSWDTLYNKYITLSACRGFNLVQHSEKKGRVLLTMHINHMYVSLYKSTSLSVSESVCLDVPKLLRNGESQQAEILRDDSSWKREGFKLKNIRIHRTVSRKIKKIERLQWQISVFPFVNYPRL